MRISDTYGDCFFFVTSFVQICDHTKDNATNSMSPTNEIPLTDISVDPSSLQSTPDDQRKKDSSNDTWTCDDCCECLFSCWRLMRSYTKYFRNCDYDCDTD